MATSPQHNISLFKVVLVGPAQAGKSCLASQFTNGVFKPKYKVTIGVDFAIKTIEMDDRTFRIQVWDTAANVSWHAVTRPYYRGSQAILLVFDVTSQESFDMIENYWMEEVREYAPGNVIKMLIGNKCDLASERVVSYNTAKGYADSNDMLYMETSAKINSNVEQAFVTMVVQFSNQHLDSKS